jgi:hypothetical protein
MGPYMALIVPSSFYRIDAGRDISTVFEEIKHLRSRASENILPDY